MDSQLDSQPSAAEDVTLSRVASRQANLETRNPMIVSSGKHSLHVLLGCSNHVYQAVDLVQGFTGRKNTKKVE